VASIRANMAMRRHASGCDAKSQFYVSVGLKLFHVLSEMTVRLMMHGFYHLPSYLCSRICLKRNAERPDWLFHFSRVSLDTSPSR
jgi:hypothetical protein